MDGAEKPALGEPKLVVIVCMCQSSRHRENPSRVQPTVTSFGKALGFLTWLSTPRIVRRTPAPKKNAAPSPNGFWQNESFRNYADYALTPAYRDGLQDLRVLAANHRPAIMCAEAVWWRCHRRIITDYLLAADAEVRHIFGPGNIELAHMTDAAISQSDGSLIYPDALLHSCGTTYRKRSP